MMADGVFQKFVESHRPPQWPPSAYRYAYSVCAPTAARAFESTKCRLQRAIRKLTPRSLSPSLPCWRSVNLRELTRYDTSLEPCDLCAGRVDATADVVRYDPATFSPAPASGRCYAQRLEKSIKKNNRARGVTRDFMRTFVDISHCMAPYFLFFLDSQYFCFNFSRPSNERQPRPALRLRRSDKNTDRTRGYRARQTPSNGTSQA